MGINRTKIGKNFFYSIFSQILILSLGMLIPRLILVSYGSEINGLLNTVSQIFVYIGLLEAGIGNASLNALYKPVSINDKLTISDVISATNKYYRKISIVYIGIVFCFAFLYPFFIKTDLSYLSIFLIIALQGLSGALTFCFIAAYKQLLIADGKNYFIQNINLVIYVLNSIAKIFLMAEGFDVVTLQFVFLLITCMQVCIYKYIIKREYAWLFNVSQPNMNALSQRNAFLVHEISTAIFSSTDILVLSTFCSLKIASIYSIYNLVFSSLGTLVGSVNNGLNYILGQTYAKSKKEYECVHDLYDSLYMTFVFWLFTVAYVMIIPFVKLYTSGVNDVNYIDNKLPLLFVTIQFLSCSRAVCSRLITIAGHAKKTQYRSVAEAIINLVVSLIFVNIIGIYGVLLGTIIALLYRANDIIIYANKKILKRNPWKTYSKLLLNIFCFCIIAILLPNFEKYIIDYCINYGYFLFMCCICTTIVFIIYFGAMIITDRDFKELVVRFLYKRHI